MPRGACDSCRVHKIRCDQERPVCQQCQSNHRQCQYIFSDTIKKSCLTCRSKKKKCDNKKPECSTCVASGRLCSYQKVHDITENHASSSAIATKSKHQSTGIKFSVSIKFKRKENFIEYDYSTHQLFYLEGSRFTIIPSIFMCDLYFGEHEGKKLLVDGRLLSFATVNLLSVTKLQKLHTQPLVVHLVKVFFNRLNCHHPILPESYFYHLMRTKPDQSTSRLLLHSICLASLTLFPRRQLCTLLRQFFSGCFFNILKKCYLSPSLPLAIAYTILSLLSPHDICHPKAKSQSFYFKQAQILLSLLGLHVKTPHLNIPRHVTQFRNVFLCNNYIGEVFTSNFIFGKNQGISLNLLDPNIFSFGPNVHEAINPPPCSPVKSINRPCDFTSNFLFIRNLFSLSFSAASLLKDAETRSIASGKKMGSTHQTLLKIEISLHNLYFGNPVNSDQHALKDQFIQAPINYFGIQNFVSYLNLLLDFYRPLIYLPTLSTIIPYFENRILVHDFLTWTPEQKVLAIIQLLKEALSAHALYFIDSSFTYKWWSVCSIFLFVNSLNSQVKQYNYNLQVLNLVSGCLQVIYKTLKLGKERTEIAGFIFDNAISMVKNPKTLVAVISNNTG